MSNLKINIFSFAVLLFLFFAGLLGAHLINTDNGSIQVEEVPISHENLKLSALLYKPDVVTEANPKPAIVLSHGISNSKDVLSGIALELARNGFVALAVDSLGHGNSEGHLSANQESNPSLGILSAVRWLENKSYVKRSSIGLVGHSLGASAIRAAAAKHKGIAASVYIGGGLDSSYVDAEFAELNSTFPRNLMLIIGEYDVLFDLEQLKAEILLSIFNATGKIVPNQLYGAFQQHTARKIIIPKTTHLFEPIMPSIASETVKWMLSSLAYDDWEGISDHSEEIVFHLRELLLFFSLVIVISSLFPLAAIILRNQGLGAIPTPRFGELADWKAWMIWGALGLLLFIPLLLLSSLILFPPLIFGGALTWWLLIAGLSGLLLVKYQGHRFCTVNFHFREVISENFDQTGSVAAIIMFLYLFTATMTIDSFFQLNLRIIVPIFRDLGTLPRYFLFLSLIPFSIAFFFVEGLLFHDFHDWTARNDLGSKKNELRAITIVITHKVLPYLIVLSLFYIPLLFLEILLVPREIGFFLEFFVPIIPVFMITTALSWWCYQLTGKTGMGALLNALIVAWLIAALFPMKYLV